MLLKIAWRNIWRNKRRTGITVASILFAVFFAVFMRSMQLGVYGRMINNMVRAYAGYVQVHANGYWEDQTLDNAFSLDDPELQKIKEHKNVTVASNRLESFALASHGEITKGIMVVGVDPNIEEGLMELSDKLDSGKLFAKTDKSVILGKELADFLKTTVGDTIVFLSQGYHGSSAAGKFNVAAIASFSSLALNQGLALLPLPEAQNFFGTENLATSTAVIVNEPGRTKEIAEELRATLDTSRYEVLDWEEAMPEIVQTIEADSAGGIIMLMVLYMVLSFGMFGTILMLVQERTYEFGVLLSLGMKRIKLWAVVFLEGIMMTLMGALLGVAAIYPLLLYFFNNPYELTGPAAQAIKEEGFEPIIPASLDPSIILTHVGIVVAVSMLITLYPAWVISRLNPVEARRN